MFEAIYSLGSFLLMLLVVVWGVAMYSVHHLLYTKTVRRFRVWKRIALIALWLGEFVVFLWVLSIVALWLSFGWLFAEGSMFVQLPLLCLPALFVLFSTIPRLRRKQWDESDVDQHRYNVTEGQMVVPVEIMLFSSIMNLLLQFFYPPVLPTMVDVFLYLAFLMVVSVCLWLLQKRRLHQIRQSDKLPGFLVRFMRSAIVVLVLFAGFAGWFFLSMQTSNLPAVMEMTSHHNVDLGGGTELSHHYGGGEATSVTKLTDQVTGEPDVEYTLTAMKQEVELSSGKTIQAWTFNGEFPGPELRVQQGDLVEVTLVNQDIDAGVTIHWHGYDVPNAMDGVAGLTQNAVQPGDSFTYRFIAEDTGTYWYHSHQQSSKQVRKGLFGSLVVEPKSDDENVEDMTILATSYRTDEGDELYTLNSSDTLRKKAVPPGKRVHLRLINTSNFPRKFLLNGTSFKVTAIDGQSINQPSELSDQTLEIAAGGRYDVTFNMPKTPVLLSVKEDGYSEIVFSSNDDYPLPEKKENVPTFDPAHYGAKIETPFDANSDFDREFTMVLGERFGFYNGKPNMLWTINGEVFPHTPTLMVKEGDLVKTTFVNRSYMHHPMHLHGHHMLVLSRNGEATTGSPWWTDTLDVAPGEMYEVAFLADNPGMWMDHCHNLDHAAIGMTLHLSYEGVTSPFSVGSGTPNQPE